MHRLTTSLVGLILLATASSAAAQSWETPSFLGPRPGADLGIYLVDSDFGDLGVQGIWRQTDAMNLGLRLGFVDAPDDAIQLGVETWGPVAVDSEEFPLDVAWTAGVGASINGLTTVTIPAGITIGKTFDVGTLPVQAYGHPRLALVAFENPVNDDLELELDAEMDLGLDLFIGDGVTLRVGATLGDFDALGIGLAWRR